MLLLYRDKFVFSSIFSHLNLFVEFLFVYPSLHRHSVPNGEMHSKSMALTHTYLQSGPSIRQTLREFFAKSVRTRLPDMRPDCICATTQVASVGIRAFRFHYS